MSGILRISPGGAGVSMKNMLASISFDPYNTPKSFPSGGVGGGGTGPAGATGPTGPTGPMGGGGGNVTRVYSNKVISNTWHNPSGNAFRPFGHPAYVLTLGEETEVWGHVFIESWTTQVGSPPRCHYLATAFAVETNSIEECELLSDHVWTPTEDIFMPSCAAAGFYVLPAGVWNICFGVYVSDAPCVLYNVTGWIDLVG